MLEVGVRVSLGHIRTFLALCPPFVTSMGTFIFCCRTSFHSFLHQAECNIPVKVSAPKGTPLFCAGFVGQHHKVHREPNWSKTFHRSTITVITTSHPLSLIGSSKSSRHSAGLYPADTVKRLRKEWTKEEELLAEHCMEMRSPACVLQKDGMLSDPKFFSQAKKLTS